MDFISFPEFVRLLPRGEDFREKAAKPPPTGVLWIDTPNPCFIEPDLRMQQPIEGGKTSVVLLDAPGAVGKSTLASELASRTKAFLWDCSKFQVGSRTFSGTILDLYAFHSSGIQKRMREGTFLFVLDALDEAQIRSGSQNFNAFVSDLAALLRDPREKPCIVLLARSDTADWVHLLFEEAGVPFSRYQIEYFDHSRAISFIQKRLDDRCTRNREPLRHRLQSRPFSEALSALFNLIYKLFGVSGQKAWEDTRVRNFLGYAPVLEALTDYVDVSNYMTLIQELQGDDGTASDPWQFLTEIIKRLSRREQEKVQAMVRVPLEHAATSTGWNEWERLYEPKEQYCRVLGQTQRVPVDPLGGLLPQVVARDYETALETILPQHPFLAGRRFANVVFKEFVYAWGVVHSSGPLCDALRIAMRDREDPYLPSKIFSHFMFNISGGEIVIDGQDFGVLYESFLSQTQAVGLSLVKTEEEILAYFVLDQDEEIEIEVLDTGSGVHFWRRLSNADVDVKGHVQLGLLGQRLLLGPATDLDCGQLTVGCEELEVDATGDVRIFASSYLPGSHQLSIRVRNESQGRLLVSWPGLGHPWVPYRTAEEKDPPELSETVRGDTLRKFIMMFRRQRTRQERTIMKARWSQDQLKHRSELMDLALQKGVLRRIPGRDHLELTSEYDSLRTLLKDKPSLAPNARQFIKDYLGPELAERLFSKISS